VNRKGWTREGEGSAIEPKCGFLSLPLLVSPARMTSSHPFSFPTAITYLERLPYSRTGINHVAPRSTGRLNALLSLLASRLRLMRWHIVRSEQAEEGARLW
jgi:hypothetical protein